MNKMEGVCRQHEVDSLVATDSFRKKKIARLTLMWGEEKIWDQKKKETRRTSLPWGGDVQIDAG